MTITLDKGRPYSTCTGERTPLDPTYKVRFYQGGKMGNKIVVLPFDGAGNLIPDDGKKEPWEGKDVEGKPCLYHPTWNDDMRKYKELKEKKAEQFKAQDVAEQLSEEDQLDAAGANDVNLEQWLRGENYLWTAVQAACKKRFGRHYSGKRDMVLELVVDEKIVPEDEVCTAFKSYFA